MSLLLNSFELTVLDSKAEWQGPPMYVVEQGIACQGFFTTIFLVYLRQIACCAKV